MFQGLNAEIVHRPPRRQRRPTIPGLQTATVIGQDPGQDNTVAYHYREYTVGLVFYRDLGN